MNCLRLEPEVALPQSAASAEIQISGFDQKALAEALRNMHFSVFG
jgi:hypothetical protein